MISREKLIEHIDRRFKTALRDVDEAIAFGDQETATVILHRADEISEILSIIEDMPSVWIPVTKGLPDVKYYGSRDVIVTCEGTKGYTWTQAAWFNGEMWFCAKTKEPLYGVNVTAWMPMPEPYKGDNDECI